MRQLFVLVLIVLTTGRTSAQFRIEYFGNMGVAISRHDSTVYIDAFHDFYQAAYRPTSPEKFQAVMDGLIHKHGVAALVTHYHDDHMDPAMLTDILNARPGMVLIGGKQVIGRIDTARISDSAQLVTVGQRRVVQLAPGLRVTAVKTWHVNYHRAERFAATDNHFFLVEWQGRRFLHLGDCELVDRNFEWLEEWTGKIDVLLAPVWLLGDATGMKLITRHVGPKKIVALHVDPRTARHDVKTVLPATVFTEYGDAIIVH